MKKIDFSKWNKYEIGKIHFVENTKQHPHRQDFADFVVQHADSVLEAGGGELIEYNLIRHRKPVTYTIVDVSDVFLSNC